MRALSTGIAAAAVAARLAVQGLRRLATLAGAYRRFGLVLPAGAVITDPEAVEIGAGFGISPGCHLYCQDPDRGSELRIGENVKLNIGVLIIADMGGKIRIGNDVLIAPYVVIRAANHRFDDRARPIRLQGHEAASVVVGNDVWIGASAVLLPGARIGDGSVIGAGSVVTGEIPPFSIAVGAPARVVGHRGEARG